MKGITGVCETNWVQLADQHGIKDMLALTRWREERAKGAPLPTLTPTPSPTRAHTVARGGRVEDGSTQEDGAGAHAAGRAAFDAVAAYSTIVRFTDMCTQRAPEDGICLYLRGKLLQFQHNGDMGSGKDPDSDRTAAGAGGDSALASFLQCAQGNTKCAFEVGTIYAKQGMLCVVLNCVVLC